MSDSNYKGPLGLEYAKGRENKKYLRYRLWRRTYEVLATIEEFAEKPVQDIIDLGAADGRMLDAVHQKYKHAHCMGVEYNQELVDFAKAKFPYLKIVQGDIHSLDFLGNSFDVGIATAVIEHVSNPVKIISEIKRVLKPNGIFILTSPVPLWEHLATLVGHLKRGQHKTVITLKQLKSLVTNSGFTVLKAQKFMLSPIGMPFEFAVEKVMRNLHLDFLMVNQLLVAKS